MRHLVGVCADLRFHEIAPDDVETDCSATLDPRVPKPLPGREKLVECIRILKGPLISSSNG